MFPIVRPNRLRRWRRVGALALVALAAPLAAQTPDPQLASGGSITLEQALTLAFEVTFGMAKTVPMSQAAFDAAAADT